MTAVLLSLHVLAAIRAVGPVCVAASMFPPEARRAAADPDAGARLRVLGRICRTYGLIGTAVPVLGLATALAMGVLTEAWVLVSIVLTATAAGVLAGVVLPGAPRPMRSPPSPGGSPGPRGCSTCSGRR